MDTRRKVRRAGVLGRAMSLKEERVVLALTELRRVFHYWEEGMKIIWIDLVKHMTLPDNSRVQNIVDKG